MADDDPVILTAGFVARIRAALKWVDGFTVTGAATFTRTPESCTVHVPPQRRPAATVRPGTDVAVKVQEAHGGGGKYAGVILGPKAAGDVEKTGTLAEADIGSTGGAAECMILNAAEEGQATHWLTEGNEGRSVHLGRVTSFNADGTPVVTIDAYPLKSVTVQTSYAINGGTKTFTKTSRSVRVVTAENEGGPVNIHTGEDNCPEES